MNRGPCTPGVAPTEGEGLCLELSKVRLLFRAGGTMMYLVAEARRWFASVVRRFMAYGWVQLWGGSVLTKKKFKN